MACEASNFVGSYSCIEVGDVVITEPTTMLTDYILAVECLVLAWMLYRHYRKNKQRTVLLWTLSLGFFGLSFIAGVQVLRIGQGIHDHFNHNDFFHLIQMVGMVLLWVGAKRPSDRAEPYWY